MILTELGARVVVLEADTHSGGRCLTMDRWFLTPDLGGAQIGRDYARTIDVANRLKRAPWTWRAHQRALFVRVRGHADPGQPVGGLAAQQDHWRRTHHPTARAGRLLRREPHTLQDAGRLAGRRRLRLRHLAGCVAGSPRRLRGSAPHHPRVAGASAGGTLGAAHDAGGDTRKDRRGHGRCRATARQGRLRASRDICRNMWSAEPRDSRTRWAPRLAIGCISTNAWLRSI